MTSSEYRKLSMLLSNIKSGSREAFSGIYFMYEKKVYFLFCKVLKSKSLAKKMTIEFFDYVYLKCASFGNAATFEKWLYTSLFSKCRRYLIENQPEVFGDYVDTDSAAGEAVDNMLARDADEMIRYPDGIDISEDMMQTVDAILSEIPLKLRVSTLQYYFCGFEFSEMASAEQISLMAVKNRLYKSHIRLETEEHKYCEIGYDCAGIVIFMPDVLTTMAESIVIPADIASGVTARTGVNCFDKADKAEVYNPNANTSYINLPNQKKSGNYVTTAYATAPAPAQNKSASQNMSPTVKVLMAIIALLVIIGGTIIVMMAVQGNNRPSQNEGSVTNADTTVVQTTMEITTKETTTKEETTTQPETTTKEETTTQPETTTQETTTKAETTTQETTQPPVQDEPAGDEGNAENNDTPDI